MSTRIGITMGRFSWLTSAHVENLVYAATQCDQLYILIGSATERVSPKNPFTYAQRAAMIRAAMPQDIQHQIHIAPINDYVYANERWLLDAQMTVSNMLETFAASKDIASVTLFGYRKDVTSGYLNDFPQWKFHDVGAKTNKAGLMINATDIRRKWLLHKQNVAAAQVRNAPGIVPAVLQYLNDFYHDPLQSEFDYFEKEKIRFSGYPYQEELNFVCADSIIKCMGHTLTGIRKNDPGRLCTALPGGFKKSQETVQDTSLRETTEETGLHVTRDVLLRSLKAVRWFDSPGRGGGLPRITAVHLYELKPAPGSHSLPRVAGSDDFASARWTPDEVVAETAMFDDHTHIYAAMTGLYQSPAFTRFTYL